MFELKNHLCLFDASTIRYQSKVPSQVILTVSHDSISHDSDWEGSLIPRKHGVFGRDKHVWPIVNDIISQTGKVSVVRGTFPRRIIDYNRSSDDLNTPALVDQRLQQFFSNYHNAIEDFIERAQRIHEKHKCLLLDIHGFDTQPFTGVNFDIILGTKNRGTIKFNSDIDSRLFFFLNSRGYRVFLPKEEKVHYEKYSGAFTVQYHSERCGISAIQIEIAKRFRTKDGKEAGIKLSKDLVDFINLNFN